MRPRKVKQDGTTTPALDLTQDGQPLVELNVQQKLQRSLSDLERTGGLTGWFAKNVLSAGDWIEREVEERRQTIGGIDNLFLLVADATDSDFNPVCACTYTLRGKMTLNMLQEAATALVNKFPKYRQRLTSIGRKFHGARFEDDPSFGLANHVRTAQLPQPAGKHELDNLMGEFIAQEWDLSKPLWEMILIENYRDENGAQCAVLSRGHHTLADGQGFVVSQLYMTSYRKDLIEIMSSSSRKLKDMKNGHILPSQVHRFLRPLDPLVSPSFVLIAPLVQLFLVSLFWVTYAVSLPISLYWSMYQGAVQAVLFLLTFWRVDMLTAPQLGQRVSAREFCSSRTVSMQDIRLCQRAFSGPYAGSSVGGGALSKVAHVTVNDVICAVMVDVLAEELNVRAQDERPWGLMKRALNRILPSPIGFFIPISLRSPGDWSMRNLSTGSIVYLDPSPPCLRSAKYLPSDRLHAHIHSCRSSLSLLKHSLWPRIIFHLTQITGQVPVLWPIPFGLHKVPGNLLREWVVLPLINIGLQSFPVLLTNVPGPAKKPVSLQGIEVIEWTALPPQCGKGTLGMGIISYAGRLCISVAADKVPESEGVARRICERFEQRFAEYVACAEEVLGHCD